MPFRFSSCPRPQQPSGGTAGPGAAPASASGPPPPHGVAPPTSSLSSAAFTPPNADGINIALASDKQKRRPPPTLLSLDYLQPSPSAISNSSPSTPTLAATADNATSRSRRFTSGSQQDFDMAPCSPQPSSFSSSAAVFSPHSPSSSACSSVVDPMFDEDNGSEGTLGRSASRGTTGSRSTANSSWYSLGVTIGGGLVAEEEPTPRGESPPDLKKSEDGRMEGVSVSSAGAQEVFSSDNAPHSYFPPTASLFFSSSSPIEPSASSSSANGLSPLSPLTGQIFAALNQTAPSSSSSPNTSPTTTSASSEAGSAFSFSPPVSSGDVTAPPPSSFHRPTKPKTPPQPYQYHQSNPSTQTARSDASSATDVSSRSSVFSTTSTRSSVSSLHSTTSSVSSGCEVSTPIMPMPWPQADLRPEEGGAEEPSLTVETTDEKYEVVAFLPGFKSDCITLATKQRRTLHIVADRWERESGAHFERKVTFGADADLGRIRAQFDGSHLRVTVHRRTLSPSTSFSTGSGGGFYSTSHPPTRSMSHSDAEMSFRRGSAPSATSTGFPSASSTLSSSTNALKKPSPFGRHTDSGLGRLGLGELEREELARQVERAHSRTSLY